MAAFKHFHLLMIPVSHWGLFSCYKVLLTFSEDSTEESELFMGEESTGIRVKRVPGDLEDEESDENEALRARKKIAKKRRTNKQGRTGRVKQQKHVHNHYHHNGAKSSGANSGGTKKKHSTGTVAAVAGILGTLGLLVGNGVGQAQASQPWMPPMGMGMGRKSLGWQNITLLLLFNFPVPPPPFVRMFR
jgi:hypothetical protein